jgi:hypothetical protein
MELTARKVVLTRRVHYVANKKWFITLPLGLLGFVAPIVNVAVPNPSIFPDCRLLDSSPPYRCAVFLYIWTIASNGYS